MINAPRKFLANRRVRRLLIFTTVVMAVWLLSSLAVAYALTRRHGPRSVEPLPDIADWQLESHRLKTSDGEELGAWFAEGQPEGPSVLLLHGHRGRRSNSLRLGKLLASQGCAVLMISLRVHGDSTGDFDDAGFSARRDVCAAVEFLERRRPGRPVIIDGNSMGSAAAIFAAGELGHRVAAYSALHEKVASHSRLVLVPGAGHGDLLGAAPELYSRAVLEFVRAVAKAATRSGAK
jgi:uncharacterized protein